MKAYYLIIIMCMQLSFVYGLSPRSNLKDGATLQTLVSLYGVVLSEEFSSDGRVSAVSISSSKHPESNEDMSVFGKVGQMEFSAVFDGMGGQAYGEIASKMGAFYVSKYLKEHYSRVMSDGFWAGFFRTKAGDEEASKLRIARLKEAMKDAVTHASRKLRTFNEVLGLLLKQMYIVDVNSLSHAVRVSEQELREVIMDKLRKDSDFKELFEGYFKSDVEDLIGLANALFEKIVATSVIASFEESHSNRENFKKLKGIPEFATCLNLLKDDSLSMSIRFLNFTQELEGLKIKYKVQTKFVIVLTKYYEYLMERFSKAIAKGGPDTTSNVCVTVPLQNKKSFYIFSNLGDSRSYLYDPFTRQLSAASLDSNVTRVDEGKISGVVGQEFILDEGSESSISSVLDRFGQLPEDSSLLRILRNQAMRERVGAMDGENDNLSSPTMFGSLKVFSDARYEGIYHTAEGLVDTGDFRLSIQCSDGVSDNIRSQGTMLEVVRQVMESYEKDKHSVQWFTQEIARRIASKSLEVSMTDEGGVKGKKDDITVVVRIVSSLDQKALNKKLSLQSA